ncbi:hypothetical protein Q7P36_009532 [Cladosporium allicinum]
MASIVEKQDAVCPYLPPELWQRILSQHTDPKQLWIIGRQVNSTWRSEIPQLLAKKYLEDPATVSLHFDLGRVGGDSSIHNMAVDMVFDRYEGESKERCVFAENPLTTGARIPIRRLSEAGWRAYERKKNAKLRRKIGSYLGSSSANNGDPAAATVAKKDGKGRGRGRFDLPPYQIHIKEMANDTELPNLKLDFSEPRREISFEWRGMFAAFFSEAAIQEKKERAIMAPLIKVLNEQDQKTHSLASIMALVKRSNKARHASRKRIRRARIKKWFVEKYDYEFSDGLFKANFVEHDSLFASESFERHDRAERLAEDGKAQQMAEKYGDFRARFNVNPHVMILIQEYRGIREDDEEGALRGLYEEMKKAEVEARGMHDVYDEVDSDEERVNRRVTGNLPRSVYDHSPQEEKEDLDSGIEAFEARERYREEHGEDSEDSEDTEDDEDTQDGEDTEDSEYTGSA